MPKREGSLTRPSSLSANNCALPLVVMLNNTLVVVAVATMTAKVRHATCLGNWTELDFFLAGAFDSWGAAQANTNPQAIETKPGTMKATRHPCHATKNPVERAAKAMPKLPASPLMPMVKPGRTAF